jgi:hypothetical protein
LPIDVPGPRLARRWEGPYLNRCVAPVLEARGEHAAVAAIHALQGRLETTGPATKPSTFPYCMQLFGYGASFRVLLGRWEPTRATRHYCVDSHKLHVRSGRAQPSVNCDRSPDCRWNSKAKVQGRHLSSFGRGYLFQDTTSHIRPAPKHVPPRTRCIGRHRYVHNGGDERHFLQ